MGLVRFLVTLKIDRLLHILVRLNEIKVRLAHMQVVNISELLLPLTLLLPLLTCGIRTWFAATPSMQRNERLGVSTVRSHAPP